MKTNKTLVAIIGMVALLATSLPVNAQTPPSGGGGGGPTPPTLSVPNQLPISMDDLQARAWESVANIDVYGWASSYINATTNNRSGVNFPYSPTAGVVDVDEIFALIKEQRLQLSVLYQSDAIILGTALYDRNWNNLFYGNSSGKINPPQNGVSKNTLDIVLNMSNNTWLQFANAAYFRIVERDADGNPVRYYYAREYDIQNGMIRFPNYFSERGGEIIVGLKDGTEVAYGLGNGGQRIIPTTVLLTAGKVSAKGVRTFRHDLFVIVGLTKEEYDQNISPLSQLVVDGEKPSLKFFAAWYYDPKEPKNALYASAVHLWPVGKLSTEPSKENFWFKIVDPTQSLQIYLAPGRYWVKFYFDGWPIGNQFYPPWQDSGGGGGGGGTEATPAVVEGN
ncbi:MAG: hypothetical protein UU95_C0029G0015 [Parcubacteria group bacterium GW2011_GWC2_42_12]|nr:MAG: hypothetical protein UU95_C0029G0015 [Parcubacteria group bacterium GW2011_GWC2_42_12]